MHANKCTANFSFHFLAKRIGLFLLAKKTISANPVLTVENPFSQSTGKSFTFSVFNVYIIVLRGKWPRIQSSVGFSRWEEGDGERHGGVAVASSLSHAMPTPHKLVHTHFHTRQCVNDCWRLCSTINQRIWTEPNPRPRTYMYRACAVVCSVLSLAETIFLLSRPTRCFVPEVSTGKRFPTEIPQQRDKINQLWEWNWEGKTTELGMGITPILVGINSHRQL